MGLEKALISYAEHKKIVEDIETFWMRNKKGDFEFACPPILIKTVKWKFDYILFRKFYNSI